MRHKTTIAIAAGATITLGLAVVFGWIFDITILKSVILGYASMKFNTALCLIITGLILQLLLNERKTASTLLSLVLFFFCIASFFQDIFNYDIGIDQLFIIDIEGITQNNSNPGRMAPMTSLCFTLLGLSLVTIKSSVGKNAAQYILHLVTIISFIAVIGYILNVPVLYKLSFLSSMAVHTAIAFFFISIAATLFNPNLGLTKLFTSKTIGGIVARRVFPRLILALLILSFLRIEAHRLNFVDTEFGIALFATSFILVGLFIIWTTSISLDKTDLKRIQAEDAIKKINQDLENIVDERTQELRAIFESTEVAIIGTDLSGAITNFNKGAENLLGYFADEVVGKATPSIIHLEQEVVKRGAELTSEFGREIKGFNVFVEFAKQGKYESREWTYIKKDGTRFPVQLVVTTLRNKNNDIYGFLGIATDISELKNQSKIIQSQKDNLEILNATKDKFFSIVAHDLKSPLNSLKAFSGLLINHYDSLSKEEILTMSQQLKNSVDNTIKMADNLITWARIQMNDIQYTPETIKVKELAGNICDVYKDVAINKGLNVSCMVEDSLSIHGDKNQIEFVIRNLVNNAIKFTHSGGSVSLTANSLSEEEIEISVSDSGVGFSDEMKDRLFTIGKKQSTNGTAGEKGTGLGLLLSYEFCLVLK